MMNLNQTELDVIRDVVRAAVADSIRTLKDEIRADLDKAYTREVVDLKLQALQDEINSLKAESKANANILKSLWSTAFGRVIIVAQGALTLWALWQILGQ